MALTLDYVIVSAATRGSEYEPLLEKQAAIYGSGNFVGEVVDDRGSWAENTKIKPAVLRNVLGEFRQAVWIDADCVIDPPEQFPQKRFDVGYIQNVHPRHSCRISGGFILFRSTPGAFKFLDEWERECEHHRKDHSALVKTIASFRHDCADVSPWLRGRHQINALLPRRGVFHG